ncbi:MAG: hypothetical protein IKO68_13740 [Oscillospiraceae bacterium]|nr:hypothetical protein [Oscillospiraceae bacterium]
MRRSSPRRKGIPHKNRCSRLCRSILLHLPEKELRPSVVLAATRLMHHLGRIFRDTMPQPPGTSGIRMDRKRARQLMEKRLAIGHKPDDHEEQQQAGPTMETPW